MSPEPGPSEMDVLLDRLREAGFRPGVTPWLGGVDTQYTRVAGGWITTVVLASYGPWVVLHGRADHAARWPFTHRPVAVDRRDLAPEEAIRFALSLAAGEVPDHDAQGWPAREPDHD